MRNALQDGVNIKTNPLYVNSRITAQIPSGALIDLTATPDGYLKVANVNDGLAIAQGRVANTTYIHKFGYAIDIDIADGYCVVWDGTLSGINSYTYSTTADIDSLSSSNDTDTQSIEVQGLDVNYNLVIQTVTLTGQTRKALDTPLIRVFRLKNEGISNVSGVVYCYVNTAIVTGTPTDTSKVRAMINDGNNQTLMAVYTIPNGKTGYLSDFYATIANEKVTTSNVRLFIRSFGGVFQLKFTGGIVSTGSSILNKEYSIPEKIDTKSDIVIIANSSTNDANIAAGFDIILVDN